MEKIVTLKSRQLNSILRESYCDIYRYFTQTQWLDRSSISANGSGDDRKRDTCKHNVFIRDAGRTRTESCRETGRTKTSG